MLSNPKWHWSASSWGLDRLCQRARFLHSCQGGTGIEPIEYEQKALPLEFGSAYHLALAEVRRGTPPAAALAKALSTHIQPLLPTMDEISQKEAQWALAGLFWAWYRVRFPLEEQRYLMTQAIVEQKLVHKETGLAAVMDLMVPLRSSGKWIYQDEKTTGIIPNAEWQDEWTRKVQMATGPLVAQDLGIDIDFSLVVAHYKGYRRKDKETGLKRWVSLFTQGWRKGVGFDGLPIEWTVTRPQAWKGAEFQYAWEAWADAKTMVERQPLEALAPLFVESNPIRIAPMQREAWLRQGLIREETLIKLAHHSACGYPISQELLDTYAPQNWDACKNERYGTCRFFKVCWLEQVGKDPVGSGLYRPRKDEWAEIMEGESGD